MPKSTSAKRDVAAKPRAGKSAGLKTSPPNITPTKSGMVRARIDGDLKAEAETILVKLGLNASDAIRLFYKQITMSNGLPFAVKIPNADTREAMREAEEGKVTRHERAAELFDKLGI